MRGSNIYSYSVSQFDRNSFSIAYQPKFKMAATVRTIVSHPKLFDCPIPFRYIIFTFIFYFLEICIQNIVLNFQLVLLQIFKNSKGVLVDKTLYITGQVGWTKEGKLVEGIEAQTRVALENMGYVLEAAGANHSNGE